MTRATSIMAKRSMTKITGTLRGQVFRYILGNGTHGAICDEIEFGIEMKHQTASARVRELSQVGLIVDGGKKRLTRSNRNAIVWVVPPRVVTAAKRRGLT